MSKPVVSVVIPAYNAAAYIAETIRSVQNQTFSDWELIVVDDGSTDETATIVSGFLSDPRVRYVKQKNAGVSAARNHGMQPASGTFIAFLDADDLWKPENLSLKAAYLEANPSVLLVHADVENIDENSKPLGSFNSGKEGNVLRDLLLWNGTVVPGPSSILVRKKAAEAIGGFDTELSTAADQDFFFRLAAKGNFGQIRKLLSQYRIHSSNMHANIALMERDHLLTYRKAKQRNVFGSSRFRRKCFANLYLILAGSWWVNGKNKSRGFKFLLKAFFIYPPSIGKLMRKFY